MTPKQITEVGGRILGLGSLPFHLCLKFAVACPLKPIVMAIGKSCPAYYDTGFCNNCSAMS